MMRGSAPGLPTPYPIGTLMPAVYQEDEFTMRWTAGLDDVLAPVIATIDCLTAYVDPLLAPDDFLIWLGGWLGAALDENWPLERRRALVASSAELYRHRGTVAGLRRHLELVTDGVVEVRDSGGAWWSTRPDSDVPGESQPGLAVRVVVPDPEAVDLRALDQLLLSVKPAHVPHAIEVVQS